MGNQNSHSIKIRWKILREVFSYTSATFRNTYSRITGNSDCAKFDFIIWELEKLQVFRRNQKSQWMCFRIPMKRNWKLYEAFLIDLWLDVAQLGTWILFRYASTAWRGVQDKIFCSSYGSCNFVFNFVSGERMSEN